MDGMKHIPAVLRWSFALAFMWVIPLAQVLKHRK